MPFYLECTTCGKHFDRLEIAFGHAHEISEGAVQDALFTVISEKFS